MHICFNMDDVKVTCKHKNHRQMTRWWVLTFSFVSFAYFSVALTSVNSFLIHGYLFLCTTKCTNTSYWHSKFTFNVFDTEQIRCIGYNCLIKHPYMQYIYKFHCNNQSILIAIFGILLYDVCVIGTFCHSSLGPITFTSVLNE